MLKNTSLSYGSVAKFFHWVVFFLVATMLLVGYFMDDVSDKAVRGEVYNIHKLTGITVLMLMLLRLGWTLMNPKPALPAGTPSWQYVAERLMHFALYAVLIAMPVCGWVGSVAAGHVPHFFGVSIGLPIAENKALDDLCFSIHGALAIAIMVLVSLHVIAALYHYVIKKDDVLTRMM